MSHPFPAPEESESLRRPLLAFLLDPFALVMGLLWTCMISVSFDIPMIHDAALAARWPVLGLAAAVGLLQLMLGGMGRLPGSSIALAVVILVAAVSTAWSADPEYSLQRSASLALLFVATCLGVSSRARKPENVQSLFDVLFVLGTAVAVGGFLFRLGDVGPGGRYVGLHDRATGAGSYAALFLPIAIYQVRYRLRGLGQLVGWCSILALFGQLVLSGSRMAAATALVVAFLLWFDYYGRRAVVAVILLALVAPIPLILNVRNVERVEETSTSYLRTGTLSTFTGRLDRWAYGLEKWQERPIIGHGFGVSRTLAGVDQPWRFRLQPGETFNLHSDQIEVLLDLGIVGFVPFAAAWIMLAATGLVLMRRPKNENRQRAMAAMGAVLFAFGDTFMHGGFLAAGGGVSAFSWSMVAMMTALAAVPAAVPVRRVRATEVHPHRTKTSLPARTLDRSRLPSVQQVLATR